MRPRAIALDGPVASGKSAVGRDLAAAFGYAFLDTGLMYRAVTLLALQRGLPAGDERALADLAASARLDVVPGSGGTRIIADGVDLTDDLRRPEVDAAVSQVSRVAGVRERMVEQQRQIADQTPIVMVGRDIGTVVLPDADLKVYLLASVAERARRRHSENSETGDTRSVEEIAAALAERDRLDETRAVSPLRPAPDAVLVDTEGKSVEEVVDLIRSLAKR
ncbi:MAG: (d)CMP kinase [Dehalococcoidia bacterium]|nr:(d)CMP kinase [Dehalococcoidia bacterium]